MSIDFMALKSGTDIRGTALGENAQLNDSTIKKIACGFARYLCEKTGMELKNITVCIGNDSRLSAARIKNALCRVLSAYGMRLFDCGLCSTPAMFMATVQKVCTASVMITASHHPADKNGLKFFTRAGGFEGEEILRILEYAAEADIKEAENTAVPFDFMKSYATGLCDMIKKELCAENYEKPLSGLHIVTDAGNGAGGFFERNVLRALGADTSGSLFLEPDGSFPNHIPNPENETAMSFIKRAVTENGAQLGVIFDTDVDRAACVDSDGREINRSTLIALASAIALSDNPGGTIVTDSVTSDGLHDFINKHLGGVHYRYKRGYKNVINKAIELNAEGINCPLAIETSGHAALRENYFLDDGAYLMTKIIILLAKYIREGKKLSSALEELRQPAEALEKRYIIDSGDYRSYGNAVLEAFKTYCKRFPFITPAADNREGWRVAFNSEHGGGWLLLRMSVHDPVLPVNIESDNEGGAAQIEKFLDSFLTDAVPAISGGSLRLKK